MTKEERTKELVEKGMQDTLHYACSINDMALVSEYLQSITPAKLNKRVSYLGTPLHIACEDNNLPLVELLLEAGADMEIKDVSGNAALAIALSDGNEELAYFLMSKGADVHALGVHRGSMLHLAVMGCGREMLRFLVDKGLNVNALASDKRSALIFTANIYGGNYEAAKFLVENGIEPEHITSAFQEACWRANPDIASLLLLHGADKNVLFGKTGKKPETLFWVCNKGNCQGALRERYVAVVKLLLDAGFDLKARYKFKGLLLPYDGSPLDKAIESGFTEVEELITQRN